MKKTMGKRIGSFLLTLCMVLTLLPAAAVPVRAGTDGEVLTADNFTTAPKNGGNFYLSSGTLMVAT